MHVIEIRFAFLHPHANGLGGLGAGADERGIVVASVDIRETPDVGNDISKEVRPFPCCREGRDAAAANAADGPACGIVAQVHLLANHRDDFLGEKFRADPIGRVVFKTPRAARLGAGQFRRDVSRIDKDRGRHGQFAGGDQIIQDDSRARSAVLLEIAGTIEKDDTIGRLIGLVLGGNINGPFAFSARIDLRFRPLEFFNLPLRHPRLDLRVIGERWNLAGYAW